MTQEEILIKVGLDGSGLDSNLQKAENRLESFGHKGHESFVHVERSGRAFHHLLGEIGRSAPLAAEALTALVNPTTGAIALLGLGFSYAIEKFKKYNETLDEVGKSNAKAVEGAKESLAELDRAQREFSKGLNIDPITGRLKAVGEEKDPATRLSQARLNRDREAALRNAQLEELKRVAAEERRLTSIPSRIKGLQDLAADVEKSGEDIRYTRVYGPNNAYSFLSSQDFNQERLLGLRARIAALTTELGGPEHLKNVSARRAELESQIRERSKAIGEFQDIIDPLAPRDALPRGRRAGTFNISGPGGTFSGTVGGDAQDIKNYLKQIAESPWVKSGKISVPNGP